MNQGFNLGDKVRDEVVGVTGTVTMISNFLTGCTRYCVQPVGGADGKCPDSFWMLKGTLIKKSQHPIFTKPFAYDLGDYVEDRITNKRFVITRREVHYEGFNRYYGRLTKPKTHEELNSSYSMEEAEIKLIKANHLKAAKVKKEVKKIVNSPVPDSRAIPK